jgi:hypothetical protein
VQRIAHWFEVSQWRAAIDMRRCFAGVTAISASSMLGRVFTSTKATALPRDDIDLAAADDVRARENPVAFRAQEQDGELFGAPAEKSGAKPRVAAHSVSLALSPAASAIARA